MVGAVGNWRLPSARVATTNSSALRTTSPERRASTRKVSAAGRSRSLVQSDNDAPVQARSLLQQPSLMPLQSPLPCGLPGAVFGICLKECQNVRVTTVPVRESRFVGYSAANRRIMHRDQGSDRRRSAAAISWVHGLEWNRPHTSSDHHSRRGEKQFMRKSVWCV